MWWEGKGWRQGGKTLSESLQFVSSDNEVSLHLFLLSPVIPHSAKPISLPRFTVFLSSPPPCFWDLYSPPYVIASPEQTGLFSFTIGPRLERLAEAQRLCFFTRSRKETEGGYCWDIASLCITSAQTCMQKISACEMRMQTNFYCTFITTKDT